MISYQLGADAVVLTHQWLGIEWFALHGGPHQCCALHVPVLSELTLISSLT